MLNALHIAATGMAAQQLHVETISNNLANMSTPGFKRSRVDFAALVTQGAEAGSVDRSTPGLLPQGLTGHRSGGVGVSVASVKILFDPGEPKRTDRPHDLMIDGDGFLEVTMPDGSRAFSRGGSLRLDADGALLTPGGFPLKPAIFIPQGAESMTIAADGSISARSSAQGHRVELGQLHLVRFGDASALEPMADGLYRSSEASGDAISGLPGEAGFGTIKQGHVEGGNVRLVDEYVGLMLAQRAYEASAKVVQASDEMLAMANNLRK